MNVDDETGTMAGLGHRRMVTGHSADGRSVVVSDGLPTHRITFEHMPGLILEDMWATSELPSIPTVHVDPTHVLTSFQPVRGATRFRIVRIPSEQEVAAAVPNGVNAFAMQAELAARAPADWGEQGPSGAAVGMHSTQTVDCMCILSGELWMVLDSGTEVLLRPGDCLIQNGTRHAWHNRGTAPCVYVTIMIGASVH